MSTGGGVEKKEKIFLRNTILTLFLTLFKTQREVRWEPWVREPEGRQRAQESLERGDSHPEQGKDNNMDSEVDMEGGP